MNIPPLIIDKTINILIIDDDEEDFYIIRDYIKKNSGSNDFSIEWCGSYQEALDNICAGAHDIYFVDFRLGPNTGLDLIKEMISNKCEQPVILLTGAGNQEIALQAMQAGAADYLVKSELNTEKLERCIRYALTRQNFVMALKANEHKYRSIFEKTKDFIFITDGQLLFKEVNQICHSLFEYTREEMLTMHFYDLLADKKEVAAIGDYLCAGGEIKDREMDLLAKNNRIINSVFTISWEKDAQGTVYMQGIIHDITDLKKAEQSTLQTAKLKAAERLVRTLAHEVRNPLNNIMLAIENIIPDKSENEKVFTDIIMRNTARIDKLITELLNSSRPAVVSLEQVSLQSILDKSISASMDRIILKKINLIRQYCDNGAWIMADPEKLSIAFLNLIINGIEASASDEARIEVWLKEEPGNYIVSIKDNGQGISEENLSQLFEPYYTSKAAGMGLGLTSALSIFESHRALVQVRSALNAGTSFNIIFKK